MALIEPFVDGTEVAVPVIDDGTGPRALPAVAIKPDGGDLRLHGSLHRRLHRVRGPAPGCPTDVLAECARVAVAAHEALGLRDLSRSDLIVRDDGTVCFLEVNVAPGLHRDLPRPALRRGRRARPRRVLAVAGPGRVGARRPDTHADERADVLAIIRLAKLGFRVLGQQITLTGLEHVPQTGGALVAVNHIGYVDFVYAGIPIDKMGRRPRFMAKRELFDHR